MFESLYKRKPPLAETKFGFRLADEAIYFFRRFGGHIVATPAP
jgi:hypothetical protein